MTFHYKFNPVWIFLLTFTLPAFHSAAAELPAPTGEVLLTISGNIEHFNGSGPDGKILELDLAILESLPPTKITTKNPWIEGMAEFEGVRIDQLLEFVGARSAEFEAYALDDYHINIDNVDFSKYPVVLAYKLNGNYMDVRELGPLWVMFPLDDYPELNTERIKSLCIWQLIKIDVI